MKKNYFFTLLLLLFAMQAFSQNAHTNDFSSLANWHAGAGYTISNPGGELKLEAAGVGTNYQAITYSHSTLNLQTHPYLKIRIRSVSPVQVRIDLRDTENRVTNANAITLSIPGNNTYATYTYNFEDRFVQHWPNHVNVDATKINGLLIYLAPGGPNFTGTVYFDDLQIGSATGIVKNPDAGAVRLNQLGYYPNGTKVAIAIEPRVNTFEIVTENKETTVFSGTLSSSTLWSFSGENVRQAVFTNFTTPGVYRVKVGTEYSLPFRIGDEIHREVTKGMLKSFYYHRASMAIEQPWGGQWSRPMGHPDQHVLIHRSAATPQRPEGTVISSPKGWYDAGDYNKYMVNSGISTYTMLALYEHFPSYFDTLHTFIPESSNRLPDILDEALWNIEWMLSAQDPHDGGVYHKVTEANFSGTEMPHRVTTSRYAVSKSTSAALNFAAVMAQASRIFRPFENERPGFSQQCLVAAIRAYQWAQANPTAYFTGNPEGIHTGPYGDSNVNDEFAWASQELYITTRDNRYYTHSHLNAWFDVPGWQSVNTLGLVSLVHNRKRLNTEGYADTTLMKTKLVTLANDLHTYQQSSAYGVVMGHRNYNFGWGSNAVAGNQGLVLLQAYRLTNDESYLQAALANLDYILGRNATGYSFVTGFGSKKVMHPHDRISASYGGIDPIPGMVVGGANPGREDEGYCTGYPAVNKPATSYVDKYCSYSTNELAINYTIAVTYVAGAIEALRKGANYYPPYTVPVVITSSPASKITNTFEVYPNPARKEVTVRYSGPEAQITLLDTMGKVKLKTDMSATQKKTNTHTLNLSNVKPGVYILAVQSASGQHLHKLIVE